MLSRERILKIDILTPDSANAKILTAGSKQFSLQSATNERTGVQETLLIIKGSNLPEVERGNEVSVITYMRSGERIKYPAYVTISTEMQLNVVIRTSRAQVMEERRRYYKVEADIDCVIKAVGRGEQRITLEKPAYAKIKDLNIGGIFLCICEEALHKSDRLLLTIMLETRPVDIVAEIIRVQTNAAGDVSGYGCRFMDLSPMTEEVFAQYVFKVQLDRLKTEKEQEDKPKR